MRVPFFLTSLFLLPFVMRGGGVSGNQEILGCGGFVRSQHKLDFDQIEIKLFSKGGSLKVKTECAPTTGYYFIPLEAKGDYVLKIYPPDGWTFSPSEVAIPFDAATDDCSLGKDINFDFQGFAVSGFVISSGFKEGPSGVEVTLVSDDKTVALSSVTGVKGAFQFDSIPPGKYSLKGAHPSLKFVKAAHSFTISNKNVVLDKELVVSGYELSGVVASDGNPVEKVTLVLVTSDPAVLPPTVCTGSGTEGISLPGSVKGRILCVETSNAKGSFTFGGLSPGKYLVVPVYKGANIVYNVSPDRQEVTLDHASAKLSKTFEVEGFTVQGRVKGHSGAKIFVNGVEKAVSGHDGTFSIANVKPGSYEFEVVADKFLFDKKQISIQPTSPVIPDFVPSKFQTCGTIALKSATTEVTLSFTKVTSSPSTPAVTIKEKVVDAALACVYLPEGSWIVSVTSAGPQTKYFLPEKVTLAVPSGARFSFAEFSGSISGSVECKLSSCDGVVVRLENKDEGSGVVVQEQIVTKGEGKFSFGGLQSGIYRVKVDSDRYCWKSPSLDDITLKNVNIASLAFHQTGIPLEIDSTHSTKVKITGKTAAATQTLNLEGGSRPTKVCLTDAASPPDSYRVTPEGCHTFERDVYSFTPGVKLQLVAKKHAHSWKITAPKKILDLKVTRNSELSVTFEEGKSTNNDVKIVEEVTSGQVVYTVTTQEEPGLSVKWEVFSFGFIFEPATFPISTQSDCKVNLAQVVAKQSHVIKGKFTPPLEGVEIRIDLVGDPDATTFVTSSSSGDYIAGPFVHSSGFKVTPTLAGYTFKPTPSDPHSFLVYQLAKIVVIVENEAGVAVPNVLLSLSGPSSYRQNKMTDEAGKMTFGDLNPGGYYLKALLKEFQFLPSALNIDLKEQEGKEIKLSAVRESFSLHGQLTSLSGELMPHLLVTAKGMGNCSEYGEEGVSDEGGNFRIWALKSYCTYQVSVARKDEFASKVERTIPESMEIKIGAFDVHNTTFIILTPVRRMDVSLRVHTNNEKSLDTLKASVYSVSSPDMPIHTTPFAGTSYIILPPIPKDGSDYVVTFESTLNKFQYTYTLPQDIAFPADTAYAHFALNFDIHPASGDQEIGKNSYIALALIIFVVGLIANLERIVTWGREMAESYGILGGRRLKTKTK